MSRTAAILIATLIVALGSYIIVRPLTHSSKGKLKIIMFGQSTMDLWFKHWNWPYPLRIKTTYKPWPIPYHKYSRGKLYLEYFRVHNPKSKDPNIPFGQKMLKSVEAGLNSGNYDAAFFKFCFVDFPVKEKGREKRFDELINTVRKVYEMTFGRNMKLIIGNSLPLPEPNDATLALQKDYNKWLVNFASNHSHIIIFDLFGPLTDQDGKLIMELAHAKDDHHPGERAFSLLDNTFFDQIESWLSQ